MRLQGTKSESLYIFNKNRKTKPYNIDKDVEKMYFPAPKQNT